MAKDGLISGMVVGRGLRGARSTGDMRGSGIGIGGLVDLRIDTTRIAKLGDILVIVGKNEPVAAARALNRTAGETKTALTAALASQTGLGARNVGKALFISRASAGALSAAIVARGGFMPLKEFDARQTRNGVSAAPWGKRRVFRHTFIPKKGGLGGNVYVRKGKARFPLHKLFGPAIPRELPKDQSRTTFYRVVPVVLAKRLAHELGRLLGGA